MAQSPVGRRATKSIPTCAVRSLTATTGAAGGRTRQPHPGGAEALGARIYPGGDCDSQLAIDSTVIVADAGGSKQSLSNTTHEDFGGTCEDRPMVGEDGLPDTADDYIERVCPNGSFGDLIRADLDNGVDLVWYDPRNCPVLRNTTECYQGDSYRIRTVPLVAPDQVTGTGGGINTVITDFTGVFVDKVACNYALPMFEKSGGNQNVYIRIMTINAPGGLTGDDTDPGPGPGGTTVKKLQLIE